MNLSGNTYICTGGVGHFALKRSVDIEYRFGLELAKKILKSENDILGISQRETIGVVNNLSRVFRSDYSPESDSDNLHRILKNLKGRLEKADSDYKEIGSSIQAGDQLSVSGKKSLDGIFDFVKRVHAVYSTDTEGISFPELTQINPKHDSELIDSLITSLARSIRNHEKEKSWKTLFLDNYKLAFLPDRVTEFKMFIGDRQTTHQTVDEIFNEISGELKELPDEEIRNAVTSIRITIIFGDDGCREKEEFLKIILR
jgi:uncharacterized protein (TIGR04141 family)